MRKRCYLAEGEQPGSDLLQKANVPYRAKFMCDADGPAATP